MEEGGTLTGVGESGGQDFVADQPSCPLAKPPGNTMCCPRMLWRRAVTPRFQCLVQRWAGAEGLLRRQSASTAAVWAVPEAPAFPSSPCSGGCVGRNMLWDQTEELRGLGFVALQGLAAVVVSCPAPLGLVCSSAEWV